MKTIQTVLIAAVMGLASTPVVADRVEAGRVLSQEKGCVACHAEKGVSRPPVLFPHLAGQHASYLEHALRGYRDGSRRNQVMNQQAAELTDNEIRALAAFYAAQDGLETATRD